MNKIVLCVDDDPDDQILVLETIQQIAPSLRVASAINGLEALQFLKDAKRSNELPCLIILDINMPLMDGKQTLMEIKKNPDFTDVPVVMFTTSTNKMDESFCLNYGV